MYIVGSSPHVKAKTTTRWVMFQVVIALLPATIAGVVLFGYKAAILIAACVIACVLSEFIWNACFKKPQSIGDLSAVVTGLILALNLPASLPVWMAVLGSVFAIIVVKMLFGGLGKNFANPALAARIFLTVSFGSQMAATVFPNISGVDVLTEATPLAAESLGGTMPTLFQSFFGLHGGVIGETCAAALILGGLYMVIRRVISPTIPVVYIGTVALLSLLAGADVVNQVLNGGLLLGAIFMATDYVTSPLTEKGKLVFGIGLGLLTVLMRQFSNMYEGVSFAILIMNFFVPYIDNLTSTKPFGGVKK